MVRMTEHMTSSGCVSSPIQWPCRISLAPTLAPYFEGANLVIAADCTAYAYCGFHRDFMKNRIALIGCPHIEGELEKKLTDIISENDIKSIRIVRMDVSCCEGIERAAKEAIKNSGKFIPWQIITISTEGKITEE